MDKQSRLARTILNGFTAYFAEFENITLSARTRFENAEWRATQDASMRRIDIYKAQVIETQKVVEYIAQDKLKDLQFWTETRDIYASLVRGMTNFEIAETFYNSIFNSTFGHRWIQDDYAFVFSPQGDMPPVDVRRVVRQYRTRGDLKSAVVDLIADYRLALPYVDEQGDIERVTAVMAAAIEAEDVDPLADLEFHVLEHHFFRNKASYVVGRIIGKSLQLPFVLPILHTEDLEQPRVFIDACLMGSDPVSRLFSFTRSYFMVDASIPSQYVLFLQQLMPKKAVSEIYSCIGHHRHGKTYYYRTASRHMRSTEDEFITAPGIKGMVMTVFTLPSYDFVFKIIKDRFTPPKEVTHQEVRDKYQLVKRWDRAGRMADTQEFANLVLDASRVSESLLEELQTTCPSALEFNGSALIIKHCYVERRMTPLNLYLQTATDDEVDAVMLDYGKAIKELAAANIFPGDMLLKNFGVTRHGRVVFYDYDEIQPLLDINFRIIPEPRNEYEEMSGQPWYSVGPNDVFPEEFRLFFSGNQRARKAFDRRHSDLYEASFWTGLQEKLRGGFVEDFFPYSADLRFQP